ncbi:hypothetical protein ADK86_08125 [Streptomyces sp. NRRL F-5755]|nr:hypothetical protein ADK86_08125 [Streptomyces sp. NRRL F-5755]
MRDLQQGLHGGRAGRWSRWSRWTCEREGCGQTGTTRGDQHDDFAAVHGARHQQEARHEALVNDAVAVLTDAREVLGTAQSDGAASGLVTPRPDAARSALAGGAELVEVSKSGVPDQAQSTDE